MSDVTLTGFAIGESPPPPSGCPPETTDWLLIPRGIGQYWEGMRVRYWTYPTHPGYPAPPAWTEHEIGQFNEGDHGKQYYNSNGTICVLGESGTYTDFQWRGGYKFSYKIPTAYDCIHDQGGGQHFIHIANADITPDDIRGTEWDDEFTRLDIAQIGRSSVRNLVMNFHRGGVNYGAPYGQRPYPGGVWPSTSVNFGATYPAGTKVYMFVRWWQMGSTVTGYPGSPPASTPYVNYVWITTSTTGADPYYAGMPPSATFLLPSGLLGHPVGVVAHPAYMELRYGDADDCGNAPGGPLYFYIEWFEHGPISKPEPWSGGPF